MCLVTGDYSIDLWHGIFMYFVQNIRNRCPIAIQIQRFKIMHLFIRYQSKGISMPNDLFWYIFVQLIYYFITYSRPDFRLCLTTRRNDHQSHSGIVYSCISNARACSCRHVEPSHKIHRWVPSNNRNWKRFYRHLTNVWNLTNSRTSAIDFFFCQSPRVNSNKVSSLVHHQLVRTRTLHSSSLPWSMVMF